MEQKGKKTHGHGQQCGKCRGDGDIKGLNGNGKNTIKIKLHIWLTCSIQKNFKREIIISYTMLY